MLQASYDDPYPVVSRTDKLFVVRARGRVSIDRIKPTNILLDYRDGNDLTVWGGML